MAASQFDTSEDYAQTGVRDLEEKQKMLKDRVLLLGENLVDLRSEISQDLSKLKRDLEVFKEEMEKMSSAVKRLGEDMEGKARKEDLAILQRQAKMFDPLQFVTVDEIKNLKRGQKN